MSAELPVSPVDPTLPDDQRVARSTIWSWALWDWASNAFTAVVTTFVFTVYLTSSAFGDEASTAAALGFGLSLAGLVIALLAPALGLMSDRAGKRKLWLGLYTAIVIVITASLFFVEPAPEFVTLGVTLVAVGNVFFELAQVNYNAMLSQVSTRSTIGRVSGFGWGLGYIGGIVLLVLILVGFIFPDVGWFGVTSDNAMNVRVAMLFSAAWLVVFAIPLFVAVPESPKSGSDARRIGFFASYSELFRNLRAVWRRSKTLLWFLLASAVFRDGLAGVFTFGGIIAATSFGLSQTMVIVFAIAGNLVAGVFTFIAGWLDDRFGARRVIVVSLAIAIVGGTLMFALNSLGTAIFWTTGLLLAAIVGPIQASSRGYLLRLTPRGQEGEMFGVYATTGRAVSFLAPLGFTTFVALFGATIFGVIGITIPLIVGLLLMIPVARSEAREREAVTIGSAAQ